MGTRHGDHWARQGPGHRHWAGMGAIAYGLLLGPSRKHSSQGGIKIPRWGLSRAIHKEPLLSKCWDIMFCLSDFHSTLPLAILMSRRLCCCQTTNQDGRGMYFFFEKQMLVSLPLRSRPYKTLGVCFASFRKKLRGRSHQKHTSSFREPNL